MYVLDLEGHREGSIIGDVDVEEHLLRQLGLQHGGPALGTVKLLAQLARKSLCLEALTMPSKSHVPLAIASAIPKIGRAHV